MIKKRGYFNSFNKEEINDIVTYGMFRGLSYFEQGKGRELDTNIIDFVNKEFLNELKKKKSERERLHKAISIVLKRKNFYFENYKEIDVMLDLCELYDVYLNILDGNKVEIPEALMVYFNVPKENQHVTRKSNR